MKKLAIKQGASCMACLECMVACSGAFYKELDMDKSCIKISGMGNIAEPVICDQCGKCAEVCEFNAITQTPKGVYMINKKLCTSCGKCVDACPYQLIIKPDTASIASKCIACGICAKACPVDVLEIVDI
ncbi:MAG: 4Fe-4S binding protein [Desulfosporosinus sp.]|nr:4Fe-4S binding protein [Desulfosporosinus sp.]